ncbi:MAG: hypothetical protein C4523_11550 [Myxococcales bacterium]|nr:MAG: hypothetical protein C4523_11550 [Myxococcales bacterium]
MLSALVLAALAAGCAPKRFEFEPVTVRAAAPAEGGAPVDWSRGPEALFTQGWQAYEAGRLSEALAAFRAIVAYYPESAEIGDAAYNAGLILKRRSEWPEAERLFALAGERLPEAKDRLDADFMRLGCLYELGQWERTLVAVAEAYSRRATLTADDRVELAARRGAALFHLGRFDEADEELNQAFGDYRLGLRRGDVVNDYAGAMAAYYLGRLAGKRFDDAPLSAADTPADEARLEEKARRLLDAQAWFLKSVEQNNAYWATASGYEVGALYRAFHAALKNAPLPDGIASGSEEAQMYACLLADRSRVLLRKSLHLWERTVEIGERLNAENAWTAKTKTEMGAVKTLYLADEKACAGVVPPDFDDMPAIGRRSIPP